LYSSSNITAVIEFMEEEMGDVCGTFGEEEKCIEDCGRKT
jgi:hypothetical protein